MEPAANLTELAETARQTLGGHFSELADGRSIIHLGYCGHSNPGDCAISLAEDRILHDAGIDVKVRVTDIDLELRYAETAALIRSNPDLPILFRGGGTLNDVYPPTALRHAAIIEEFGDRSIVEAAVGIHFSTLDAAEPLRRAVAGHPDFRLLVRDDQSHEWAKQYLDCPVSLVPDAVLSGRPGQRRKPETGTIGVAVRDDLEAAHGRGAVPPDPSILWGVEPRAWQSPRLIPSRIRRRLDGPTALTSFIEPFVARGRLTRAVRQLISHEVVVADRLHVALLCIMHGIPVVAVDNSYGKVSAAFRTWHLEDLARARLVEDFTEAMDIAGRWTA